jgi:4-hydroxy-3-polyprenylbenzoate decarboxylase
MAKLARLGVTILPPEPPFYLGFSTVEEVVDFVAHRTLVALGLADALPPHMQYRPREE